MTQTTPPRWDLSNVYSGLESGELKRAIEEARAQIKGLEEYVAGELSRNGPETAPQALARVASGAIDRLNETFTLVATIRAYLASFISTDSYNTTARRLLSEFEQEMVRLQKVSVRFQAWVGKIAPALPDVLTYEGSAKEHAFALQEAAEQSRYLMSEAEEDLAAELNLSGANAWSKLQGTVTSQLSVDFELDGETKKLPMPALINLRSHPDEDVRRRAYETEMQAWESVRETLAACMNGVKGTAITLNRRRGREDALHSAIDAARIDRPTLETLLEAMRDSFPAFRRYFRAKARKLGKEKLAWWDLFAPLGKSERTFTFDEARRFIVEHFATFSPDLAAFAQRAFENHWIDAEQRDGKRGGAFCMSIPAVKESRILCNFDGSLDQVFTIAHELGHAYHNECAFRAGQSFLQRDTPMTLAETASIMCETIAFEAVRSQVSGPEEELAILEKSISDSAQVIVDIYSRFLFEKEVFERRERAELSADELCEIMENAQKATYGDGLDDRYLHKYMWTWKPHYYFAGLSFYNFPYAFGLLFGIGLYAIYQQRGPDFVEDYKALLASTGEAKAADLAARFGIDIRDKKFWEGSLRVIEQRIERFEAL